MPSGSFMMWSAQDGVLRIFADYARHEERDSCRLTSACPRTRRGSRVSAHTNTQEGVLPHSEIFALQHSDLNAFLYADVATEQNDMMLPVMSVLARMGMD